MLQRPVFLFFIALLVFVGGGRASAGEIKDDQRLLAQVMVQTERDLRAFTETGLPAYARMQGDAGDYLLTAGNRAHLQSLRDSGFAVSILDDELNESEYYFAFMLPGILEPEWDSAGRLLLDDGRQKLMRLSTEQAHALASMGVQLQQIVLTPKPLIPTAPSTEFPEVIDPDPTVQFIIDQITSQVLEDRLGGLSGEWPITVGGSSYTLTTRNTNSGTPIQKATQYVGEQLEALGLDVEYHQWAGANYPNVIGEIPGQVNPDQIYMIGAHLDDMPSSGLAPGADDNGSGSVATLLAAELFSQYHWGCTVRFAFWTGEEQGLLGSHAYAQRSFNTGENIAGYLNMDMIAWNTAGSDPQIELHAKSSLPATLTLAQLYADVVAAYNLNLNPVIVPNGSGASDHASFWSYNYTSILAIEDFSDFNPFYHTPSDDMDNFQDWPYFTDFTKASLAAFVHMTDCLIEGVGALEGTVTAEDGGAPIQNADIEIRNSGGEAFQTTTDAGGYYTSTLVTDAYTITASAYGYLPQTVSDVPVLTGTVTTQDFVLQTAPTYTVSGFVREQGTGVPLLAQIRAIDAPVAPVWTDPVTGFYTFPISAGIFTLEAVSDGHHMSQQEVVIDQNVSVNFNLEPLACILLVDDDNNTPDVRTYYTTALDNLGYTYDVFDVGGGSGNGPGISELSGYRNVFWFSGDKYSGSAGPNGADEAALATYLEAGGNLFLSSQDYLYDFGLTTFNQNYLGVGSYSNDIGDATVKYGVSGDPVGNGHGPYSLLYPAGFSDYGDVVNPQGGASVAFRSGASGGNNLDLDNDGGDWKSVFFGTSWVPVYHSSQVNGEELLGQVVTWFGGCESSGLVWEIYMPIVTGAPQGIR